jgi:2-polyprenyl-6-methoxyphenol hydroxylase-like FAD-dependent oxidoreductase
MASNEFKVIVIGGGPVGLTAAHALHLAGNDFVVLERRTTVVEDVGASLVLTPASMRVMHQFGLLDNLLDIGQGLEHARSFDSEGNIFYNSTLLQRVKTK